MCIQDFFFREPYGAAAVTLQVSRLAWIFCSYSAAVRMEIFCYFASILILVLYMLQYVVHLYMYLSP